MGLNRTQDAERAENTVFAAGDFDLDIQIAPSEAANTSSL